MTRSKKKTGNAKRRPYQVTWAQAFRDIIIAAMNRGQLLGLAVFMLLAMMVWKMDGPDVYALAVSILETLVEGSTLGYAMASVFLTGWFVHARSMRKQFSAEYERIGLEKSGLQSSLNRVNYSSSDQR